VAVRLPSLRRQETVADTVVDLVDAVDDKTGVNITQKLPRWLIDDSVMLDRHIREGRFQRTLSLVAGLSSVLSGLEVLTEHYRGSYSQRVMYSPIILSPALLAAGIWGAISPRAARTVLPVVSLITVIDGVTGFAFHVRGIHRKPGGWRNTVYNLVMGPPVLAPLLFALSGYLGLIASLLRPEEAQPGTLLAKAPGLTSPRAPWLRLVPRTIKDDVVVLEDRAREGRIQQQLAIAAAISALLSGFEALYSHYKNNFQFKVQWTPIILTPLLCGAGLGAVWNKTVARTVLPIVSLVAMLDGAIGTFYHVRGILRRPGGLKTPIHNLIYGPPSFAPMLFAASGFLGLLASLLRRAD